MSGGPALDDQGRLIGVNVAARRDGEQVSFLVPGQAGARADRTRPRRARRSRRRRGPRSRASCWRTRRVLTQRFIGQPWRGAGHAALRDPGAAGDLHALLGPRLAAGRARPAVRAQRLRDGQPHLRQRLAADQLPDRAPRGLRRQQARPAAFCRALFGQLPQRVHGPRRPQPHRAALRRTAGRPRRPAAEGGDLPARLQEARGPARPGGAGGHARRQPVRRAGPARRAGRQRRQRPAPGATLPRRLRMDQPAQPAPPSRRTDGSRARADRGRRARRPRPPSSRVFDVAGWPLRIGRALDNHLVLDDPWVARAARAASSPTPTAR